MKIQNIKKKISLCNLCGKCVPVCPSFRVYKTEAFSPRGRLFLISHEKEHQSFDFCLFCERCKRICPNNISFPEIYLEKLKREEKSVFSKNIPQSISKDPLLIFLKINNWLHLIDLTEEQQVEFNYGEGDIVIYNSCGLKHFYPQAFKKFDEHLKRKGINAGIPQGLVCCGAIFLNLGLISQLKENALKNLEILEKTEGPIVVFCATCLWMFKKVYPQIFRDTVYEERFSELSQRVISAYGYLSLEMESELRILEERALDKNVLFHLPCHLTEEFNLVKKKLEVKDFCCGSPKFFLWLKGFQEENKREWIKNLENKNILATHCTGCYLNFSLLLKRPPLVCHWLELL